MTQKLWLVTLLLLSCAFARSAEPPAQHAVDAIPPLPPEVVQVYGRWISQISVQKRAKVKTTARTIGPAVMRDQNEERQLADIRGIVGQAFPDFKGADIEALVLLVMMQCAKDSEEDLKSAMDDIKKAEEQKQRLREQMSGATPSAEKIDVRKPISQPGPRPASAPATKVRATPAPAPARRSAGAMLEIRKTGTLQVDLPIVPDLGPNSEKSAGPASAPGRTSAEPFKEKLDTMNEISDMTSTRLQMMMERRSKFISTLSNLMKKMSSTQDSVIQNLK